jgi:hypothetical protein
MCSDTVSIDSPAALARATWLVARPIAITAVMCLGVLGVLHRLYLNNPTLTEAMRNTSVDHLIIAEQANRAKSAPPADISILGDSSCLFGIDPIILQQALSRTAQLFCSTGYVGPSGYAHMLSDLIDRGGIGSTILLAFNPATFRRHPSWDYWADYVRSVGKRVEPTLPFFDGAMYYLQFEWINQLIYNPLPGAYSRYYGGEGEFRKTIRDGNGGAIDPVTGLTSKTAAELKAAASPAIDATDFSTNDAYIESLKKLAGQLKRVPNTRVYLMITPVSDAHYSETSKVQRAAALNDICEALELDISHILNTPASMYDAYFSATAHLNRWGRIAFSHAVARATPADKPAR